MSSETPSSVPAAPPELSRNLLFSQDDPQLIELVCRRVREQFEDRPELPWDAAIAEVINKEDDENDDHVDGGSER